MLVDEKALYIEIGKRIRAARTSAEMTQDELAEAVGMSRTSIVNIEHGRQRLLIHSLVHIANATGVPPQQLIPPEPLEDNHLLTDLRSDRGFEKAPDEIKEYLLKEFRKSLAEGEGNDTSKADT